MILTPNGAFILVGPLTRTTSAPLSLASSAIAYPILPVDLLVKNLTGSILALVGPAVTSTFLPTKSFGSWRCDKTTSAISSVSASFPSPTSPQANRPLLGFINSYP